MEAAKTRMHQRNTIMKEAGEPEHCQGVSHPGKSKPCGRNADMDFASDT